jgi:hypothetical protein
MFDLDTRRLGVMCGKKGPPPVRTHEFIETLTSKETLSLLGRLQQEFGLHGSVDSDPRVAVAQCLTWIQSELRSFETNSAGLVALLSALAAAGQSTDLLTLEVDEGIVSSTHLKALKMCRDFENGGLVSQLEQLITSRVEEAVQAGDSKRLREFLIFLSGSSAALVNGPFARKTAGRILTHKLFDLGRNLVPADTIAKLQELGFAVLHGQKSRVSELVRDIDATCGTPKVQSDEAFASGWFDWWREQT